jgi:hypothetical protein
MSQEHVTKKRAGVDRERQERAAQLKRAKLADKEEEDDGLPEPDDDSDHTYSHNEFETDSSSSEDSASSVLSSRSLSGSEDDSENLDIEEEDAETVEKTVTTTTVTTTTKKVENNDDDEEEEEETSTGSSSDETPSHLDICESRYRLLYHQHHGGLTDIQKHVYESIVNDSEWGPVTSATFAQLSDDEHYDVLDQYARALLTQALPFSLTENRVKHVIDALKF